MKLQSQSRGIGDATAAFVRSHMPVGDVEWARPGGVGVIKGGRCLEQGGRGKGAIWPLSRAKLEDETRGERRAEGNRGHLSSQLPTRVCGTSPPLGFVGLARR